MSESRMMVMVASLERHLEEERKILFEAIIGQGALPVGLAYPTIPANYIHKLNLQCIADADYVLLLIGGEYGALTEKGVGYIHTTYAAAQAARKPVLSLIFNGEKQHATDTFDQKRLNGLIDVLKTGLVYYWNDEDSLRDCGERGLEHIFETYPCVGWIRADLQPLIPETTHEDLNLIHKLKHQVSQLKDKITLFHSNQAPEPLTFDADTKLWELSYQCNAFREGRLKQIEGIIYLELPEVFRWVSASLLAPVTEGRLKAVISSRMHEIVLLKAKSTWSGCHAVSDIKIDQLAFDDLKVRFRALGLITFDTHGRWQLTPGGEQLALQGEGSNI